MFRLALIELALGTEVPPSLWKEHRVPLGKRARERLLEALSPEASDVDARRAALVVAAVAGESAAIDLAIDALIDDAVAREADAALRLFGPSALHRILARVAHGDAALRAAAIRARGAADKHSAVHALRAATDVSTEVASAALADVRLLEDIAAVFAVVGMRIARGCAKLARHARQTLPRGRAPHRSRRAPRSVRIATRSSSALSVEKCSARGGSRSAALEPGPRPGSRRRGGGEVARSRHGAIGTGSRTRTRDPASLGAPSAA